MNLARMKPRPKRNAHGRNGDQQRRRPCSRRKCKLEIHAQKKQQEHQPPPGDMVNTRETEDQKSREMSGNISKERRSEMSPAPFSPQTPGCPASGRARQSSGLVQMINVNCRITKSVCSMNRYASVRAGGRVNRPFKQQHSCRLRQSAGGEFAKWRKTQARQAATKQSQNHKLETRRDGAATQNKVKTLKCRGSGGSRGLLGCNVARPSRRRPEKLLLISGIPPKNLCSLRFSAFQGFCLIWKSSQSANIHTADRFRRTFMKASIASRSIHSHFRKRVIEILSAVTLHGVSDVY